MIRRSVARAIACVLASLLATWTAPLRAQDPPPAQAPAVQMPVPVTPLTAPYPEGESGDVTVILRIVVEIDGSVSSAEALESARAPDSPDPKADTSRFRAAAVEASSGWKLSPARRAGAPIRAAIRVSIRFHQEPSPVPPSPDTPPPDGPGKVPVSSPQKTPVSPPPPPAPTAALPPAATISPDTGPIADAIDVSVRGVTPAPGAVTMDRTEVRLLPGAFGDPFRAVEMLPGVTPIASGLPYFYVRGAPPGNVGYFVDQIRVPLLYHLGLGPSVIHPAMISRVDLYPGGYPAQYGRFAGAIVSGETRPPGQRWSGEAQIRVVDAGAFLEAPFPNGRGAAAAAGRYSYTGLLFSVLQSDLRLDYWDYEARAHYDVSPTETVSLLMFGARDYLGDKQGDPDEHGAPTERTLVDTTFHRVDLRYEKRLGARTRVRQAFTFGYDRTGFDSGGLTDMLFATRTMFETDVGSHVTLRGGMDANLDVLENTLDLADLDGLIPGLVSSRLDLVAGPWLEAEAHADRRFEVRVGIRADLYQSSTGTPPPAPDTTQGDTPYSVRAVTNQGVSVEPRISATLRVSPWLRFVQAHGVATQRPSFFLPGPGFSPDLAKGLQWSLQSSAGVEMDLPLDIDARVYVFHNASFDLTDPLGTSPGSEVLIPDNFQRRAMGATTGLEVSLRRRLTKRVGGVLSYTLSRSDRIFGPNRVVAATDRTHVLNLALGVDIWRGLRAGLRTVVYSGFPHIVRGPAPRYVLTESGRLPPFFRLDARLEKRWSLGGTKWISAVLEMQNATLSTETLGLNCTLDCEPVVVGPVSIPSIGVEGGF